MNTKAKVSLILLAGAVVICAFCAKKLVGYKQSTELLVKQSPFGTLSCV